jgi:hypothetical protein
VSSATNAPQVRGLERIHRAVAGGEDFRRHVMLGACHRGLDFLHAHGALHGDAEVDDLDAHRLDRMQRIQLLRDDNIGGFEVPMNDVLDLHEHHA